MSIEQTPRVAPSKPSLDDMEFCHICVDETLVEVYCGDEGAKGTAPCQGAYEGEAICPSCGHPTCPRCAVLSDLEDRLENDGS
jgi:hypothetical protein